MSLPSRVQLIQHLTPTSGKVRVLGNVLAYDVSTAIVSLEFDGHVLSVDMSMLVMARHEDDAISLKIVIGECAHVMGYIEQAENKLVLRAIMYWAAGNLTYQDKAAYKAVVEARNEQ